MSKLRIVALNGQPLDRPPPLVFTKEPAWQTAPAEGSVISPLVRGCVLAAFVAALILGPKFI
jgi:hypothetical protein